MPEQCVCIFSESRTERLVLPLRSCLRNVWACESCSSSVFCSAVGNAVPWDRISGTTLICPSQPELDSIASLGRVSFPSLHQIKRDSIQQPCKLGDGDVD